nr:MAG TPA: hypothetical protein [Caudoviricetes sp.]
MNTRVVNITYLNQSSGDLEASINNSITII